MKKWHIEFDLIDTPDGNDHLTKTDIKYMLPTDTCITVKNLKITEVKK